MMEARRPCPDAALLAAFLDGGLAEFERTAIVTHLAECSECRAVALTVVEFREVQALDDIWHVDKPPAEAVRPATRMARWTLEKTRAPALVLATVVLAGLLLSLFVHWTWQPTLSTVIQAAAGQRPIEGRVTDLQYAPPPDNSVPDFGIGRWRLASTATRVRATHADDYGSSSRRAVGVAALLSGGLDDAISSLSIGATAAPNDPRLATDLAAALYERARQSNRPDDLPAALNAAERALALEPAAHPARFNRALILSALGLRVEAERAWQDYRQRDPDSSWAEEARTRAAAAYSGGDTEAQWAALRGRLLLDDPDAARLAARRHGSRLRDYLDRELLHQWIDAPSQSEQWASLAHIERLGAALVAEIDDRFYRDFVAAAKAARARGPRTSTAFVAAHRDYVDAMTLVAERGALEAIPAFEQAVASLGAARSPFEVRARLELSSAHHLSGHIATAAAALPPLLAAARASHHVVLIARAKWIEGVLQVVQGNFAGAQVAYDEMLAAAHAAKDADALAMGNTLLANLLWMQGDGAADWRHRTLSLAYLPDLARPVTRGVVLLSAAGDAQAAGYQEAALVFLSAAFVEGSQLEASLEAQGRIQRAAALFRLGRIAAAQADIAAARRTLAAVHVPQTHARIDADLLGLESEILQLHDPAAAVATAARALGSPENLDPLRTARLHLRLADARIAARDHARAEEAVAAGLKAFEVLRSHPSADAMVGSSDPAWGLYLRATELALGRGDLASAFAFSERRRLRTGYERRRWGAHLARLEDVQTHLHPGEAVLVLNQLGDQLRMWVIRRHRVSTHAVPLTVRRAHALVASHLDELSRSARRATMSGELFDLVLRPLSEQLFDVSSVVVIADAPYDRIAYAGLWDSRRGRFLVEDYRIAMSPSATAFLRANDRRRVIDGKARQASFVGFGSIEASVERNVDGSPADVTVHYQRPVIRPAQVTTVEQLLADVEGCNVVHVSALVAVSEEFPAFSRLQVADEPGRKYSGSISGERIAAAENVSAQVVAIDARDHGALGGSTLGVARALLAAGVPSVVGTVAELERAAVSPLWVEFHRNFAGGANAAESLRRAQLTALGSAHRPGPWATLTLFGSNQ